MAIAGQVYSGKQYALYLGRQTASSTPVAMGTAESTNAEFVELDVVTINDIDFAGGLVTDRTLRTGQQVKKRTDHYVSEKGSSKGFNFEWVCSHKEGLKILLELISEDTSSPYSVAGNHEPPIYNHGATTGKLATIIIKSLDSGKAAGQDRTMHSAALTNLSFAMDSATQGGRLVVTGTFMSGYTVSTAASGVTEGTTETRYVKSLFDCTTKKVDSLDVVVKSFNLNISYPCVRVGYQGANGEAEMYSRAGEITCDGSISVLYDTASDAFLATMLTDPGASASNLAPIILSDNATVGSGNFAFEVLQAVITGHNLSLEGAEEGMFVELTFEGTATASENLFRVDCD
jgi:hypothetical protein